MLNVIDVWQICVNVSFAIMICDVSKFRISWLNTKFLSWLSTLVGSLTLCGINYWGWLNRWWKTENLCFRSVILLPVTLHENFCTSLTSSTVLLGAGTLFGLVMYTYIGTCYYHQIDFTVRNNFVCLINVHLAFLLNNNIFVFLKIFYRRRNVI